MRFYSLTETTADPAVLQDDRTGGREIGKILLGRQFLFCKHGLKTYYSPYSEITRYFRRVQLIPAKMCCGRGDFEIENLVIHSAKGEVAQIQLPGTRAGKALMEELKQRAPHAISGKAAADDVSEED